MSRIRLGAVALGLAGVLFVLYPALRPWNDESTAAGAAASMSSANWVMSHFFAMVGFVLAPLGLLALRSILGRTRGEPPAAAAVVASWIGAGLTLPYYGAEDFGLHAAATWGVPDLVAYAEAVRYNGLAITIFGIGLILFGIGGILAAVALWRAGSTALGRIAGLLYAAGTALFLPQFFTPAGVRIGHGVLLGVGAILLAVVLWSKSEVVQAVEIDGDHAGIMAR